LGVSSTVRFLYGILRPTVYVRIRPNRFLLRHVESGREATVDATEPFSTRRLLVGEYGPAVDALEKGMTELRLGNRYLAAPVAIMHPLEMVDGGLSGVEYRILFEIAVGAGAKRAKVWVGEELTDEKAREKAGAA
jgi:hypothetical protein